MKFIKCFFYNSVVSLIAISALSFLCFFCYVTINVNSQTELNIFAVCATLIIVAIIIVLRRFVLRNTGSIIFDFISIVWIHIIVIVMTISISTYVGMSEIWIYSTWFFSMIFDMVFHSYGYKPNMFISCIINFIPLLLLWGGLILKHFAKPELWQNIEPFSIKKQIEKSKEKDVDFIIFKKRRGNKRNISKK